MQSLFSKGSLSSAFHSALFVAARFGPRLAEEPSAALDSPVSRFTLWGWMPSQLTVFIQIH